MKSPIAEARDKFIESDVGAELCKGEASAQYLHNRIDRAFLEGWRACEKDIIRKFSLFFLESEDKP